MSNSSLQVYGGCGTCRPLQKGIRGTPRVLLRQPGITSVIPTCVVGVITRQVHGRDARSATCPTADQNHPMQLGLLCLHVGVVADLI